MDAMEFDAHEGNSTTSLPHSKSEESLCRLPGFTEEEGKLFRSSALWYRPIPGFVKKDENLKSKIKPCVRAILNGYMIARKTRGDMSDVLRDDSCREKLLRFALPVLELKQYSFTLTARIASLSSQYETARTVSAHAIPSNKCIACSLTVSHPMKMQHALDFLSKLDEEILAARINGENEHSARMFNTLLIMKEMLAYFDLSTVSDDKTNKVTVTVPHEEGAIVSAEKLCVSCQRKSVAVYLMSNKQLV